MPSPRHPCAHVGCTAMLARKEAIHCAKHHIKTPEHQAKITAALRGKRLSEETRLRISIAKTKSDAWDRLCPQCDLPFRVKKPSARKRFCSRRCGYLHRSSKHTDRICSYCGALFPVDIPSSHKRFCSDECSHLQRSGERSKLWLSDIPHKNCEICGVEFRPNSKKSAKIRRTCSDRCRGILQKKRQKTKNTSIEMMMATALKSLDIKFKAQYVIPKVAIPDFYIPHLHAAVFCDGDYWHSLPGRPEKDRRQDKELQRRGYTVIRFWEHQIRDDVNACAQDVLRRMPSRTLDILL